MFSWKKSIHFTYSSASSPSSSLALYTRLASKGSVKPLWLGTIASTASIMKHASLSARCLTVINTLNLTSSSYTLSFNYPFCTSIIALPVARNGLLCMMGISLSFSMSDTMKSAGKINLSPFTKTSSMTPRECFIDLSASCSVTLVGLASPKPNRLKMDNSLKDRVPYLTGDCKAPYILQLLW